MAAKGYPIHPPYEVFYIESMLFNTTSAMRSLNHLNEVLKQWATSVPSDERATFDEDDILNNFQNVILHGAALSRYFWPVGDGHSERAQLLRESCGVDEESPLKSRTLRNALEHFDEKLDEYLADGIVGHVFPQHVGPRLVSAGVQEHRLRAYYTDVGQFELLGKRYPMEPLANEIARIHEWLTHCLQDGGRLKLIGHG